MSLSCNLLIHDTRFESRADELCRLYGMEKTFEVAASGFQLALDDEGLKLFNRDERKQGAIFVDFVAGANAHRRKFGGGKGQAIAKAVGIKPGQKPTVIDGTAGLGKDAFVLAGLGCSVLLIERHPVVRALLDDGLHRAYEDPDIGQWMRERMQLCAAEHINQLDPADVQVDVVYLDPMYPHREKSALVKKDMRAFQTLVGADLDSDQLLEPALALATKRVVVKRPDYAEPMAGKKPTLVMDTKKNRFDIYITL